MVDAALADGDLIGLHEAALLETLASTGCRCEELANADREDPGSRTVLVIGKGDKQSEVYSPKPQPQSSLGRAGRFCSLVSRTKVIGLAPL